MSTTTDAPAALTVETRAMAVREEPSALNLIAAMASDPNVDVAKFKALVELQQSILAQQAEAEYNRAMSLAQADMEPIVRDANNSHTRSKYATLERIDAAIRPIYTRHGFALSSNSEPIPNGVRVLCEVTHSAGHKKLHKLEGALDTAGAKGASNKTDIQGLGSSITYLRRYLTIMIFNLALTNEDDDGNKAGGGFIDAATVTLINDLIKQTSANKDAFLDWLGAEDVESISVRDKAKAINGLMAKKKEAAPKAEGGR